LPWTLLLWLPAFASQPKATPDGLIFDVTSASAVLELLDKSPVAPEAISSAAKLPGTQAMIAKMHRYDPRATTEAFELALTQITAANPPDGHQNAGPFDYTMGLSGLERSSIQLREDLQYRFSGTWDSNAYFVS
jgi:hypothetical protein